MSPCFSKIAFACLAVLIISSGLSLLKRANCTIASKFACHTPVANRPLSQGAGDLRARPREYQRRLSDHTPLGGVVIVGSWETHGTRRIFGPMWKSDVICPKCSAGYRRIALASRKGTEGEYRCLLGDHVIEVFDGSFEIALRLTIQPEKTFR
jgi:hypothetical protein